jgi:IS30 family transposase
MSYSRVTYDDRIKIHCLLQQGKKQSEIAKIIGKDKSTVSREIRRNKGGRGYRSGQAHGLALARQSDKCHPSKMDEKMIFLIKEKLGKKWSPEQISGRLKFEGKRSVCSETIYKFIYQDKTKGGELWKNLRRSHRTRRPRFPSENRRGTIKDARSISERPGKVDRRKRKGDWERDTMLGKDRKCSILALVDRKSRFNKFVKLDRRQAPKITAATVKALRGLPVKTITNDRGQEFSDHKSCSKKLNVQIYFCDPYSSYQRGTNENRIGILRQYFPKKMDLSKVTHQAIKKIEFEINNRPMKCLDWRTPYEVMMKKSCTGKL